MTEVATAAFRATFPAREANEPWSIWDLYWELGYCLFLLINFAMLVRPQELLPEMGMLHLYEGGILVCLLIYGQRILQRLKPQQLYANPITVSVLGLAPVIVASGLWNWNGQLFWGFAVEYVKIVAYYLILICALDTPAKLRRFFVALGVMLLLVGLLPILCKYGYVELESIRILIDRRSDLDANQLLELERILGVGIFADPNDLAQIMAVGVVLCAYGCEVAAGAFRKVLWIASMGVLLFGIYLSQSRGGLLAVMAGMAVLLVAKFGWRKAVWAAVLLIPVGLIVFSGRRSDFSPTDDSAQTRVQMWSDAIQTLRDHPLFGVGPGAMSDTAGQVAHNSFLHAYADWGVMGGYLFFLAYFTAIWGMLRLARVRVTDPELRRVGPVLLAMLAAYTAGLLTLTRNYVIPTYIMIGLVGVYLEMVRTYPVKLPLRLSMGLLGKAFAVSAVYLLVMQVFVKAFVRWN